MQLYIVLFQQHWLAKQHALSGQLDKAAIVFVLPGEKLPLTITEIGWVNALLFCKFGLS
ncbi:hypothetical protein L5M38_00945 [Shewanella sp. SM101]|nr:MULTISPECIES: hypothetical protein [unclassified Shewanella]MCU8041375.1 hypothetical protein [Shewanella sp. SM69]MCU8094263.1 hypothetical protein [Shewanella sp. SM20]MCU8103130.1 hypothetical protein [Shewanella sp. SM101]